MSVARSSSVMLTIGCIAYRREGVTVVHSAGEVQSAIALLYLNFIVLSFTDERVLLYTVHCQSPSPLRNCSRTHLPVGLYPSCYGRPM